MRGTKLKYGTYFLHVSFTKKSLTENKQNTSVKGILRQR